MIQQVVISPRADGPGVDLEIHGRLAAVLASLEAWATEEKRLGEEKLEEYARLRDEGFFRKPADKIAFASRFQRELAKRREAWKG